MFKILGNKINEVQGTTCGLGTPHALKFRSRGRSLHSLTSSGPISHHPPSCIFPLGDWLLLETEYLKQMASFGLCTGHSTFQAGPVFSSSPLFLEVSEKVTLFANMPKHSVKNTTTATYLSVPPFIFLHFTCHHVTFYKFCIC